MKITKRIISFLTVALLIAATLPTSVFAAQANTPKEEVVYVNLNSDGSVKEIYVVNIFELDKDGKVIDYGEYESLRNMTATDEIGYSGNKITVDAKAGKLYYEGKLKTNVIPWNISIRYYMNGSEYTAKDIAGKSGDLKITVQITKNEECEGNFFEGYALQTSLSLNTEKCTDIKTENATIANVGKNKQLTYTVLPGKGADIEITAKVVDFQMGGISLNGVRLKLNIEIGDDKIDSVISQVIGSIGNLDGDSIMQLVTGAEQLHDATTTLKDNVGALHAGVGSLANGMGTLNSGLATLDGKTKELMDGAYSVFKALCQVAQNSLNQSLSENGMATVTITPENYEKVVSDVLKKLDKNNVYDIAYKKALQTVTEQVESRANELYAGYIETIADSVYETYIRSQADSIYKTFVTQELTRQLVANGFSEEYVKSYLLTDSGRTSINYTVNKLTAEQKEQILIGALATLTDDQKSQIRAGAVASLTADQKNQIKQGYIEQTMKSEEVTNQINSAVSSAVSSAVKGVTELKGQLDNYSLFYEGLKSYTDGVGAAASGAATIKINMDTLYANVGKLNTGVSDLNDATGKLNEGVSGIVGGNAGEESGEESKEDVSASIKDTVKEQIDNIIGSVSGGNTEIGSFVSSENENINAVQFVIKAEGVNLPPPAVNSPAAEVKLTFWQKLLRLFGLYK